jgi:hypothetical protein
MLVWIIEYIFCDNLTSLKLIFPLIFILPVYSVLLYRLSKEKPSETSK